jgi:predicted Zn-dependent peptidase
MEHLNEAKEEDYKNFYKDFYVPNNAIVSIAGDIDYETAKAMIIKYFGDIPKSKKPVYRPSIVEPTMRAEIRDTVYDNVQLPAVIQTYRVPAQGTPDYYAVSMLGQLLSQGGSSRFNKALVDEQQKALFVGSFPLGLEDPGVMISFGISKMGVSILDLENAMDAEVEKVKNELVPQEEFQKLKNQVESDFISGNSRVAGIAENLANYKMYFGDTNLINTELDRYLAVTPQDLMNAAKKYFTKNNRVVLHYLPKSAQP